MTAAAIEGRAHVFGDNVDTDMLAPGAYMKKPLAELARHCLEAIDPDFVTRARKGDIIVGGRQFGCGSSREQAADALLENGIGCVVAVSFARIFYRNALNVGLPVLICPAAQEIPQGARLRIDPRAGAIAEIDGGRVHHCEPIPEHLMRMLEAGGLLAQLEAAFAARKLQPGT